MVEFSRCCEFELESIRALSNHFPVSKTFNRSHLTEQQMLRLLDHSVCLFLQLNGKE